MRGRSRGGGGQFFFKNAILQKTGGRARGGESYNKRGVPAATATKSPRFHRLLCPPTGGGGELQQGGLND